MARIFTDGFDHYGANEAAQPYGKWPLLTNSGEVSLIGDGINLSVNHLPSGKWLLKVNGVEMIFDRRPEFTIPQPPNG